MNPLIKRLFPSPVVSKKSTAMYNKASKDLDRAAKVVHDMQNSFTAGGSISFVDLGMYDISTGENPVPLVTGENCICYRLEDTSEGQIRFYCLFKPKPKSPAKYGWHNHPDCVEETIQITGTARALGKSLPPLTRSVFKVNEYHDYVMTEPGSVLVTFTEETKE